MSNAQILIKKKRNIEKNRMSELKKKKKFNAEKRKKETKSIQNLCARKKIQCT